MNIIVHRVNTANGLIATPVSYGVEVDIRSDGSRLILSHEPFSYGEPLEGWLSIYRHGTLILNVKEEGLEPYLIELLKIYDIKDYFLLDQSFPFLLKYAEQFGGRCAIRYSEYEAIETAERMAGRISWVWVDCFKKSPLTYETYVRLKAFGYKICIVSPELHGRADQSEINLLASHFKENHISLDAVCTKEPNVWELYR